MFLETTHGSLCIYIAAHLHVFGTEWSRGSSQVNRLVQTWPFGEADAVMLVSGLMRKDGGEEDHVQVAWMKMDLVVPPRVEGCGKVSGLCLEVGWSRCSLLNVNYSSLQIRGPALRRYSELKHLDILDLWQENMVKHVNTWCFEVGVWPQTVMMHQWLFNLEFPEMVFVITRHEFLRKRWVKMQQFRKENDRKLVVFFYFIRRGIWHQEISGPQERLKILGYYTKSGPRFGFIPSSSQLICKPFGNGLQT